MHVHMHIHIHISIYIYINIYICINTYIYKPTYTDTYMYIIQALTYNSRNLLPLHPLHPLLYFSKDYPPCLSLLRTTAMVMSVIVLK